MSRFDEMPRLTDEQRERVEANLGLVGMVLRSQATDPHYDDKFQNGVLGLMRAAQLFRPELGWRFSTYAVQWIRAGVQRGLLNEMGVNFRRAHASGEILPAPLNLDAPATEDGATLADLVPDNGPRPDEVGADRAFIDQVRARAERLAHDDADRAIVEAMFSGNHRFGSRIDTTLAPRLGMSRQAVYNRRHRIMRDLRTTVAA